MKMTKQSDNVILVGMSGCGKSTVGRILAYKYRCGFFDIDQKIVEREKMSISDIFSKKGEEYFRSKEKDLIQDLQGIRSHVISTGGGAVIDERNWAVLTELGKTVFIDVSIGHLVSYLQGDKKKLKSRPVLSDKTSKHNLKQHLEILLKSRIDCYKQADFMIDANFLDTEHCVIVIADRLCGGAY